MKTELLRTLQTSRTVMLSKLDGLSDFDQRRTSRAGRSTCQHADILREQLDGRLGGDVNVAADEVFWAERRSQVQAAADWFRP